MKKIVILILLSCLNNIIYGQNNLSFSQAMIIDLPAVNPPLTVPPNKVWKIEAIAQNSAGNPRFTINDLEFEKGADSGPIWLNSGNTIKQGGGSPVAVRASILEFDVSSSSSGGTGSSVSAEGLAFAGVVNEVLNISISQGMGTGSIVVPSDKIYKITSANAVIYSTVTGQLSASDANIFLGFNWAKSSSGSPIEIYLEPGTHIIHHMGPSTGFSATATIAINGVSYFIQ